MNYFSGQGKLYIATADGNGVPGAFRWLGNVSAFGYTPELDVLEHIESYTGQRATDLRQIRSKKLGLSMTCEGWDTDNLALLAYGSSTARNSGTVSAESLPDSLVAGDIVSLAYPSVSNVVVHDASGNVVSASTYTVNATHGSITFASVPASQPMDVDYSYGASTQVKVLTAALPERWLRFEGVNTAHNNDPVVVEFYRVAIDPSPLTFISEEIWSGELTGSVLADDTKTADGALGNFGRIVLV